MRCQKSMMDASGRVGGSIQLCHSPVRKCFFNPAHRKPKTLWAGDLQLYPGMLRYFLHQCFEPGQGYLILPVAGSGPVLQSLPDCPARSVVYFNKATRPIKFEHQQILRSTSQTPRTENRVRNRPLVMSPNPHEKSLMVDDFSQELFVFQDHSRFFGLQFLNHIQTAN